MKRYIFALILFASSLSARENTFYLSGMSGLNWLYLQKQRDGTTGNFKTGWLAGGAIGFRACGGFRIELESAYRRNSVNWIEVDGDRYHPGGAESNTSVMINLTQDINCFRFCAIPYVGFGAGYAFDNGIISVDDVEHIKKDKGFAWQAILGLNYPLTCQLEAGLEYRFFKPQLRGFDQSIGVALRYYFW